MMFGEKPPVDTDLCRRRFMRSVHEGDLADLQKRVDIGIDVNFCDLPSRQTPLLAAVKLGQVEAVELLLEAKADIRARDSQLNTALHISVRYGSPLLTETLIKAGCSIEECDCRGDTVMLKAARSIGGHEHIPVLLQASCRVDAISRDLGRTPLHFAVVVGGTKDIIEALLEAKCSTDVCDDRDGNLPLHLAAQVGRLDLVETLVRDNVSERAEARSADHKHDQIGSGRTAAAAAAAKPGVATLTAPSQPLALRPRSYLQRQNRWGCTPHDLAFMDDHRDVAQFLRECTSEVETQHVLDRNLRIETDTAHRQSLEKSLRDLISSFQQLREQTTTQSTHDLGTAGTPSTINTEGDVAVDEPRLSDRQMRRRLMDAVASAVATGLVDEYNNQAVHQVRMFLRSLITVDTRLVATLGIELQLRVIDVDSQKPYPYLVEVNGGDLPNKWMRIDSVQNVIDDTEGNSDVPYQLVKDPFEVLVEESPYFNSPRFEDPNEKIPPAKEGDIVEAHARNGQWIMTLDHVWLPLVDEYGVVVLRSAETETKEEEEGGSGGSGDVLPTHRE